MCVTRQSDATIKIMIAIDQERCIGEEKKRNSKTEKGYMVVYERLKLI